MKKSGKRYGWWRGGRGGTDDERGGAFFILAWVGEEGSRRTNKSMADMSDAAHLIQHGEILHHQPVCARGIIIVQKNVILSKIPIDF